MMCILNRQQVYARPRPPLPPPPPPRRPPRPPYHQVQLTHPLMHRAGYELCVSLVTQCLPFTDVLSSSRACRVWYHAACSPLIWQNAYCAQSRPVLFVRITSGASSDIRRFALQRTRIRSLFQQRVPALAVCSNSVSPPYIGIVGKNYLRWRLPHSCGISRR